MGPPILWPSVLSAPTQRPGDMLFLCPRPLRPLVAQSDLRPNGLQRHNARGLRPTRSHPSQLRNPMYPALRGSSVRGHQVRRLPPFWSHLSTSHRNPATASRTHGPSVRRLCNRLSAGPMVHHGTLRPLDHGPRRRHMPTLWKASLPHVSPR